MHHRRANGIRTWIVSGLLGAAAFLTFRPVAAVSLADFAIFDETKALVGSWRTLEYDANDEAQPMRLKFTEKGVFWLDVADSKGAVVQHLKGQYTYASSVLTLNHDGESKKLSVKLGEDTMDVTVGTKSSHWIRALTPPKKE